MKNINFKVSQDTIEKLSEDVVISDSYNYICLIFNFDSSWSQYNVKKATFFSDYEDGEEKYEADIINNVCVVPFEILKKSKFKDSFFIGVYGQVIEDEILKQRNTTNMISFKLRQGAYFANALNSGEIEPSAYDLYLAKLKEVFENGIKDYNLNATQKINEYNKNADKREEEINNKVSDIEKIEENIEQIQKNVQTSEKNAKTSETNAKTSEQSAQNSAKKSSESESNIISIEKNINDLKKDIDNTKTQIDEKAKEVKNNSDIAIEQAKVATEQATLSGQNANKTSADKEDISQMKVSIEASEDNIEEIEKNVQAIKDDIEAAKNETLEAKEEVENSLENERIISDKKYARALKTQVEDIEQIQVYAENDEVENLTIKGAPLTQKVREGYNKFNLDTIVENKYISGYSAQSTYGQLFASSASNTSDYIEVKASQSYLLTFDYDTLNVTGNRGFAFFNKNKEVINQEKDTIYNSSNKSIIFTAPNQDGYLRFSYDKNCNNIQLVEGTEEKPYEQYGASPSLDFPSEVQIVEEQKISIFRKNIIDTNDINKSFSGVAAISKNDGGINININGTPTLTFFTIKSIGLNVPIKVGTKLFMNYGKTEKLLKDNTDFSPYFWLVNKNGTIFKTLNRNNIINGYSVEQEIYRISFGIEALVVGKEYSEDIYIELEISDKQPTQFQKYEAIDISIALENGFNGALKNYYNEIKKLDGKWFLLNKFAHYVLDGTSSGKKVTAKQSRNNIDKYDVLLGTDKIYIDVSKDYWKPNLGICNYLKNDKAYGSIVDENNTNYNRITFWKSGQDQMSFSTEKDRFASIDEANAYLKQLYDAGKPLEFYVLMSEDNYETIELPEDIQKELNKFKLYDDLNNVFIDKGSLSFKYNKSLLKVLEEKDEKIDDLQSQIDEIKTLLSSTSTASLLLENLANDNESEVS